MLYNVFIKNGIAIDVKEYNKNCVPCSESSLASYNEKRTTKLSLPINIKDGDFEAIRKYINLNNIL